MFEYIINNPATQVILAVIAIAEFIISIVAYFKISKVRKSQIEYRNIIELDTILKNIEKNNELLNRIRSQKNLTDGEIFGIDEIVAANNICLGAVRKANQILLNSGKTVYNKSDVVYHETGYFDREFFDSIILSAKHNVTLFIKRNTRPFTLENLHALSKLADQNVTIDIFAFSPEISIDVLTEMQNTIPNCPSVDELLHTQKINKQAFIEKKKSLKKPNNFNYYEYLHYPDCQYIIVDNKLYWGIVNFNKKEMDDPFGDRPYIEMSTSSKFSQYIIALQQKEKDSCQVDKQ